MMQYLLTYMKIRDELFEYNLRLIKYCNDPKKAASDHFMLIL